MERYLSQQQLDALYSLKNALSSYNGETYDSSVMRDVLNSVVYRYEDRGFRTFDVNDLQKRKNDLQERCDELCKQMQESKDRSRYEELHTKEELHAKIIKQIRNLEELIEGGGKEMLLGTYHYDVQHKRGVITLFLDNINDASKVLPKRFGSNAGVYLLQYVFVHEAFHAYFDMCHNDKIQEIEEAMAEYASLCFLSGYDKDVFSLAEYEINEKKNSPIWTSAYGFGEYLYHAWKPDFINDYRSVNQQINPVLSRVKKYVTMFGAGYPFGEEAKCIKLLYQILYGKKNLPIPVAQPKQSGIVTQVRDYTKYHFNGKTYCKRRLVLAVIKEYAKQHPIDDVKDRFDPVKNGSRVVVKKYSKLSPTRPDDSKRYFIEANDRVLDCNTKEEYVVDNQWGRGDEFDNFLKVAKNLGYKIR